MDIALLSRLLGLRVAWRSRDWWDAGRIADPSGTGFAGTASSGLLGFGVLSKASCGSVGCPPEQLPVVTKSEQMANFDQAVTVPGLRLADVEDHLRTLSEIGGGPGGPVERAEVYY